MQQSETRKLVTSMAMLGGVALFVSSFWVTDKQTAVNRRYAGMIAFGAGLAFK
jgi:NO-binding membrane sensor protein with MHYT domain